VLLLYGGKWDLHVFTKSVFIWKPCGERGYQIPTNSRLLPVLMTSAVSQDDCHWFKCKCAKWSNAMYKIYSGMHMHIYANDDAFWQKGIITLWLFARPQE